MLLICQYQSYGFYRIRCWHLLFFFYLPCHPEFCLELSYLKTLPFCMSRNVEWKPFKKKEKKVVLIVNCCVKYLPSLHSMYMKQKKFFTHVDFFGNNKFGMLYWRFTFNIWLQIMMSKGIKLKFSIHFVVASNISTTYLFLPTSWILFSIR